MSEAQESFQFGIRASEDLLAHFDAVNCQPPPENAEGLEKSPIGHGFDGLGDLCRGSS